MNARIDHRICWRAIGLVLLSASLSVFAPAFSCTAYAVEEGADNDIVERDSTEGSGAFVGGGLAQDSNDYAGKTAEDSNPQVVESQDSSTTEKLSGWQWDGLSWYYYFDDCRLTGMQNVDGSLFYLDPARDGAMSCGWILLTISGITRVHQALWQMVGSLSEANGTGLTPLTAVPWLLGDVLSMGILIFLEPMD